MQDDPQRLIAIEEKLAFLEKHVGELDGVVRGLADRIDQQTKGIQQVRSALEQHLAGGEGDGPDPDADRDRPPHW
jgi:uncharacterized coiled-coil protein SlyX